jgi:hypothetical protein
MQILSTHVWKWKKRDLLKLFQEWGKGKKENEGGGEFKYDKFDIRIFVNSTMYPQYNKKREKILYPAKISI